MICARPPSSSNTTVPAAADSRTAGGDWSCFSGISPAWATALTVQARAKVPTMYFVFMVFLVPRLLDVQGEVVDDERGLVDRVFRADEVDPDGLPLVGREVEALLSIPRIVVEVGVGGEGGEHRPRRVAHLEGQGVEDRRRRRLGGVDVEPEGEGRRGDRRRDRHLLVEGVGVGRPIAVEPGLPGTAVGSFGGGIRDDARGGHPDGVARFEARVLEELLHGARGHGEGHRGGVGLAAAGAGDRDGIIPGRRRPRRQSEGGGAGAGRGDGGRAEGRRGAGGGRGGGGRDGRVEAAGDGGRDRRGARGPLGGRDRGGGDREREVGGAGRRDGERDCRRVGLPAARAGDGHGVGAGGGGAGGEGQGRGAGAGRGDGGRAEARRGAGREPGD